MHGEVSLGREDQDSDEARYLLVFAFAAHAHHLVRTAYRLLEAKDHASAVPLLRVAYESALTAVWAAESEDAAHALFHRFVRDAEKLRNTAADLGWFDDLLERVAAPEAGEPLTGKAQGQADTFAVLCDALEPHSKWLYMSYRLLSAYAHPSSEVVKMFEPEGPGAPVLLAPRGARGVDYLSWWHSLALILLHAGQALDGLDREARRRNALQRAGGVLGWGEPLRMTAKARRDVTKARAERADADIPEA